MMSCEQTLDNERQGMPVRIGERIDVFISYGRGNKKFVAQLYKELERHNISAWVDLSELHIEVGENYSERIQYAIDGSEFFLLIYTKEIENSEFVINQELGYAISRGKTILCYPQDLIDIHKSKISHFTNRIKWIDFINKKGENQETDILFSEEQRLFMIRMWLQYMLGGLMVLGNYTKLCGTGNNEFYNNETLKLRVVHKSLFYDIPEEYQNELDKRGFNRRDKVLEVVRHIMRINPDGDELKNQLCDFIEKYFNLNEVYIHLIDYLSKKKYDSIVLPSEEKFCTNDLIDTIRKIVACGLIDNLKSGKTMFNGTELGVYNIKDCRTSNAESLLLEIDLYYSNYFTFKCMTKIYQFLSSIDESPFSITSTQEVGTLAPFLCSIGLGGFIDAETNGSTSILWKRHTNYLSATDIWHFSYDETVSLLLDAVKDKNGQLIIGKDNSVYIEKSNILNRAIKEAVGASILDLKQDSCGIFEIGIIRSERLEIEMISRASLKTASTESPMGKIRKMFENTDMGFQEFSQLQFLPLNDDDFLFGKILTPESYAIFRRIQQLVTSKECEHKDEIFISYSRHDAPVVHPFVKKIQDELKIKCWIDMKGIESGDQFEDVIIEAINKSKIVLFMLSDNSIKSNWTKKEVYYAEGEQKRIVPIVIDNKGLRGWFKFHFGNVDYIDSNSPELVSKLIQNLTDWLKIK